MKNSDVELVYRILDGDDSAFSELVKKYQKPVHALIWRKIGDFHIAEEITQDTFLKAYQRLSTLKKPQRFTSWLYVIAANNCKMWLRKKRLRMQSIEETDSMRLEKATYSRYVSEENEQTIAEAKREVVKQLLAKLQESDRTVITLHYFSDMSAADIGAFLGVSVNTIKSRLRRAQQRLRKEEPMVREALEHFQITPHLTENIMREVSRMKPIAPSGNKPLVPLAVSAATALFIFLIMGVGSQYLTRFQRPYNIDAQSETTVEIIDAPIVLDTQAKPDLRNQAGRFDTTGKNSAAGSQLSEPVKLGAAQVEKEMPPSTQQQWVQASGPEEASVLGLQVSTTGDIYAASSTGIYRLAPSASAWTLTNASVSITGNAPMVERDGTLYLVSANKVLASTDSGEIWQSLGERPKGYAIGLVITDDGLYLALDNQVFRSTDAGQQWTPLDDKVEGRIILAIASVENTVFVGTTQGLYRLHADTWEKLPMDTTKAIHSLAVSENNLYVGTGFDLSQLLTGDALTDEGRAAYAKQLMGGINSGAWEIFHSTDLGNSWTEITPTSNSLVMKMSPGIKVLAAGETLFALGLIGTSRSMDGGKTWTELGTDAPDVNSMMNAIAAPMYSAVVVDEGTLFKTGFYGSTRSTDGGESWHSFSKGMVGTRLENLMAFKSGLYINTGTAIAKSTDGGKSWSNLHINLGEPTLKQMEELGLSDFLISPKLTSSGDILYGITLAVGAENRPVIFHLSADGSILVSIQGVPSFPGDLSIKELSAASQKASTENITEDPSDDSERSDDFVGIAQQMDPIEQMGKYPSGFTVSGETFYVEYKRRLFRWKRGEPEWFNTGLVDIAGIPYDFKSFDDSKKDLKLAVSGETVYVGKRDGHLFRSLDGGNTWKDLTTNLPLRFEHFNEIAFADSTVYVATDTGVLTSVDGEHWHVITDNETTHTVIDRIAVTDMAIYAAGDKGVYQLNNRNRWEQILPEVPDSVISLVINNDRLYIATEKRGMFHISLEKENN